MEEEVPAVKASQLVTLALADVHAWVDSQDTRLELTAAIAVAACAGRSPAASAFADACLGFGGRCAPIMDGGRLGRPLITAPQRDAVGHWTHWPHEHQNNCRDLVSAVVRSFIRCRCGVQLTDGEKATSTRTAFCSECHCSLSVFAVRQCPATAAALAAITEAYERAGGSVRYVGIVMLGLETGWTAARAHGGAAVAGACRVWGATTLRGLIVPSVPSVELEEMLRNCPHLTSLAASAAAVAAALARTAAAATAGADVASPPIPHFGSALHTLDLTSAPVTDAALDAIAAGLPQLRALAIVVLFQHSVTAAAWRRNLLLLLGRLEVLELRWMSQQMFTVLNSLADRDCEPFSGSSCSVSCLTDLRVVPLRSLALSSGPNVHGDAAAFVEAVGRHQQHQSGGSSAGLFELRLADVTPDTWLAAPRTVTHLRIDYPRLVEALLAAILDGVRLPNLKCLTLALCHSIFPHEVVYRKAPLGPAFARSPLRFATHATLRTLRVECLDTDSGRTVRREAWMAAILGASRAESMYRTVGRRFPRLRHVVFNGVALTGWPDHDPFVPPSQPPPFLGFVRRIVAALSSPMWCPRPRKPI